MKQALSLLCVLCVLVAIGAETARGYMLIDDFEGTVEWSTLEHSTAQFHGGAHSGFWADAVARTSASCSNISHDWSGENYLSFWVYSAAATGSDIFVICYSENATTPGIDYFSWHFNVDWEGSWRNFVLSFDSDFGPARSPLGWHQIDRLLFSSSWGIDPINGTALYFDDIYTFRQPVSFPQKSIEFALAPGDSVDFPVLIQNTRTTSSGSVTVSAATASGSGLSTFGWVGTSGSVTATTTLSLAGSELATRTFRVTVAAGAAEDSVTKLELTPSASGYSDPTIPLIIEVAVKTKPTSPPKTHPFLFIDTSDIADLKQKAADNDWAASYLASIQGWGESIAKINTSIPEEVSWWLGYYVCPDDSSMTYTADEPYRHYCASTDTWYENQPELDGSWAGQRHSKNAAYAQQAALSYAFTGNATFARLAADILLRYAKWYPSELYHGQQGLNTIGATSGGKIQAETLSEASWTVQAAWAYDLIYNQLTQKERAFIEFNLLRPLVIAVLRNNAGTSNWQVLHNEAIGVIGYLLGIDEYVQKALHGVSGFEFHMQNSMLDDGLWYEGSLGYHFLSLGGYETLAEVALRHGTDLYHMTVPMTNDPSRTKSFRDMYLSPVLVALPDLTLPALNDGGGTLTGNQDNYEVAYSRFPEFETQFGWALCKIIAANGGARRSLSSFLYGKTLPSWCTPDGPTISSPLGSMYLDTSGLAILRTSKDDYLLVDNGPHGGWHGHFDKHTVIFYTHENLLIKDYGTVNYKLPAHADYFKRTLPHSAIMIDGACQTEVASGGVLNKLGKLVESVQMLSVLSPAITESGVKSQRTMVLISAPEDEKTWSEEYPLLLDILETEQTDNASHTYDALFHSEGALSFGNTETLQTMSTPTTDVAWSYLSALKTFTTSDTINATWKNTNEFTQHFETNGVWTNIVIDGTRFKDGSHSGRWDNHDVKTYVATSEMPQDWSAMEIMSVWIYSEVVTNETVAVVVNSPNETASGSDYYHQRFKVDWTGWKLFFWNRSSFGIARWPIGWNYITSLTFSATWWGTPVPETVLFIDCLTLWDASGEEMAGPSRGLRLLSPPANHEQKVITTNKALSIPTSTFHPMVDLRQQAGVPSIHLLQHLSSPAQFVDSVTTNADATTVSFSTKSRSYTFTHKISSGIAVSCWVTTASVSGVPKEIVGYACQEFSASQISLKAAGLVDFSLKDFSTTTDNGQSVVLTLGGSATITATLPMSETPDGIHVTANDAPVEIVATEENGFEVATFTLDAGTWKLVIEHGSDINTATTFASPVFVTAIAAVAVVAML